MNACARFLAVSAVLWGASATPVLGQDSEVLYEAGIEARERGDDIGAVQIFRRLLVRDRRGRVLAQLGLAELAAGDEIAAEGHLSEALASDDPWVRNRRRYRVLTEQLGLVRSRLAQVVVLVSPDVGARIRVRGDSRVLPVGEPFYVRSGTNVVTVLAPGYRRKATRFVVEPGDSRTVLVTLELADVGDTEATSASEAEERDMRRRRRLIGGVCGGGIGGLVLSIVLARSGTMRSTGDDGS